MKESVWGYWIIVLGVSVMSVMVLMQNFTTTSEQDYYLIKSVMESSMYDAVDYGYYSDSEKNELKINAEKFVENFVRRFAEQVNINKEYRISFYDIYETPPYAVVSVTATGTGNELLFTSQDATEDVTNRMAGILYTTVDYNPPNGIEGE
jgi:hypothetical protein